MRHEERMNLLAFIIIGLIAGWTAGQVLKGYGFGIAGDIIVGIVGAIIGGLFFDLQGITNYGFVASLLTSLFGAVILLAIVKMFRTAP